MSFVSFNTNNQFIEGVYYEHDRIKYQHSDKTG